MKALPRPSALGAGYLGANHVAFMPSLEFAETIRLTKAATLRCDGRRHGEVKHHG